jgi:hypothetical protein
MHDACMHSRCFKAGTGVTWCSRLLLGKCNTGMEWEKWAFFFFDIHLVFSGHFVGCFFIFIAIVNL